MKRATLSDEEILGIRAQQGRSAKKLSDTDICLLQLGSALGCKNPMEKTAILLSYPSVIKVNRIPGGYEIIFPEDVV